MRYFIYILLFLWTANLQAQDKTLFKQGNQHYADQEYEAAIQAYQKILKQGQTSAEVYFNLGNAFYKLDSLAPSIYFYNKALQLSPTDEDVKINLKFAKQRTIDVIEESPDKGWNQFWEEVISTFNYNTWAIWAIVFSFLFVGCGIWYYFTSRTARKRLFFSLGLCFLILGVLSVTFAYQQFEIQHSKDFAIVFAPKIAVHVEPNQNSTAAFTLHEGTKVKVLDIFNGFAKIELVSGQQGWIKIDAVKQL